MTVERVKAAQQEIAKYLPPQPEYVVTTSEFDAMKARLLELTNRHRIDQGSVRPTLRRRETPSNNPPDDKPDGEPPVLRRH